MMLVFIAPELGVATAASQYMAAKKSMNKLRGGWTDENIYSLTHAFYANMGGFVVAVPKDEAIVRLKGEFQRHGNPVADFRALQAVFRNKELDYFRVSLPILVIARLRNLGLVFDIDEVDITDKSKADTFTKVFAIFQYGALVIQSIARPASGLSITELELMTMAFVLSALFTYILWWDKPFDVQRSHVLDWPYSSTGKFRWDTKDHFNSIHRLNESPIPWNRERGRVKDISSTSLLQLLLVWDFDTTSYLSAIALYTTGLVFSAIHLSAWNWEFPAKSIQTLWRCFSLTAAVCSGLPLLVVALFVAVVSPAPDDTDNHVSVLHRKSYIKGALIQLLLPILLPLGVIVLCCYIVSRLALLVLTFYCFTSMPVSAYEKLD